MSVLGCLDGLTEEVKRGGIATAGSVSQRFLRVVMETTDVREQDPLKVRQCKETKEKGNARSCEVEGFGALGQRISRNSVAFSHRRSQFHCDPQPRLRFFLRIPAVVS